MYRTVPKSNDAASTADDVASRIGRGQRHVHWRNFYCPEGNSVAAPRPGFFPSCRELSEGKECQVTQRNAVSTHEIACELLKRHAPLSLGALSIWRMGGRNLLSSWKMLKLLWPRLIPDIARQGFAGHHFVIMALCSMVAAFL